MGNTNPFEKSLFLMAAIFYAASCRMRPAPVAGLLLIVAAVFLSALYVDYHNFTWGRVFMALAAQLSLLFFFCYKSIHDKAIFMLKTISAIAPLMLAYGLLLNLIFDFPLFMRDHTGANRLGGAAMPAFLAAAGYGSSIAAAYMYLLTKKHIYMAIVILCLVICIMSGTRMPSLMAVVASLSIILYSFRSAIGKVGVIAIFSFSLFLFLILFGEGLLHRFEVSSNSGRDLLWNSVLEWLEIYPLIGVGFGMHADLIPLWVMNITGTAATHNEYIRLVAELGYIGVTVFAIGLLFVLFGSIEKYTSRSLILSIIVFGTFFLYAYSDNVLLISYSLLGILAHTLGINTVEAVEKNSEN